MSNVRIIASLPVYLASVICNALAIALHFLAEKIEGNWA